MSADPRAFLRQLYDVAVAAADPDKVIGDHLPEPVKGRTVVVGAGKASAAMAASFEAAWKAKGYGRLEGLVVTRYGHFHACEDIEIVEAAHPVPDEKGAAAAGRIYDLVKDLGPDDQVVALISGEGRRSCRCRQTASGARSSAPSTGCCSPPARRSTR